MRALAAAACGALLAGLAGCGGVDLSSARGVRPGTAGELQKDVLAVTQAAAVKNWPATRTAIASLRATLAASRSAGTISTQRADEIDAAVRAVLADLPAVSTATPSPSTTAAPVARTTTRAPARAPVPTPVTGKGDKGPGKGKHDH